MFSASLRGAVSAAALLGGGLLCAPAAHAQARLSFTGGSGAPLSIILNSPVTYRITTVSDNGGVPTFIFVGTGNFVPSFAQISGSITFSINGGSAQTLNIIGSGVTANAIGPNDLEAHGGQKLPSLAVNDTVVLRAGTLTTTSNFAGVRPDDGSFTTFMTNLDGSRISSNGTLSVVAPEPGSGAFLLALGVPGVGLVRRRAMRRA